MIEELAISTEHCIIQREGHTMLVTLNRPEAKNAFTAGMLVGMYKAWRLLDSDDSLYCAILTANGNCFCAGMDLKGTGSWTDKEKEEIQSIMKNVPNMPAQALLRDNRPCKPIILAVEGYALAGGTEILQGTDIRVGAEDSIYGVTEVARGLYPNMGSTIRLRRQIPYALAAEALLTGRRITAAEALQWGLINRVVPKGQSLAEAKKYAELINANGPLAVKAVTRSLREHQECLAEEDAMIMSEELGKPVFASQDAKEGMLAFKEKRTALFKGE